MLINVYTFTFRRMVFSTTITAFYFYIFVVQATNDLFTKTTRRETDNGQSQNKCKKLDKQLFFMNGFF